MRWVVATGMTLVGLIGCAWGPSWSGAPARTPDVLLDNPLAVPLADPERVWETLVSVISNYDFRIESEDPPRQIGDTLTEGVLKTFPLVGATIFEPWFHDSANSYERLESTLQTMRRRVVVRVMPRPPEGRFLVEVVVFKELEDLPQPVQALAGPATFHYDGSLTRIVNPVGPQPMTAGWIKQGRDPALEQRILGQLYYRIYGGPEAAQIRLSRKPGRNGSTPETR
jgi:hypothetical protein